MTKRLARIATFPATRVGSWVTLAAWLVVLVAVAPFASQFESAQENRPSSFLPGASESVEALELLDEFPSGEVSPAVVIYGNAGGLTPADRAVIARDRQELNAALPEGAAPSPPPIPSEDGTAALLTYPISSGEDSDAVVDAVEDIRGVVGEGQGDLEVAVTGPAGFTADAISIFDQINTTLLLATAGLVFVLLVLIYRSPIFWILPLGAVLFAEWTTRAAGFAIADAGVIVNGQTAGILLVLVFGAGTDYALLLTSRYREELRRHRDRHVAMSVALRRGGPAILASAGTNVLALLCLALAAVDGTAGLGPLGAMGIAIAMIAMLTALPAVLVITGRRAFWPYIPRYGSVAKEQGGRFRRLGDTIARGPRRVWIGTALVLAVMALGTLTLDTGLTQADDFRGDVESVEGQELLAESFPAGAVAPTSVIVEDPAPPTSVGAVRAALLADPAVAQVGRIERGPPGAKFDITLVAEPYSQEAFDEIEPLREVASAADPGGSVLIGGPTAEEADFREAATRDNLVLIPLVLVVVFVVLTVLLRALVAPLVLIATVVLSFAAALGFSVFVFEFVFGFSGESPTLVLFAFVFLVALGVDYNIFLMARVREEAVEHGTREGAVRALALTGSVITAAGVVLAGTFSVLGVLPLVTLTEIGFVVAFGVLLDTFVVRSVLVPALVLDIGRPIWWPSSLGRSSPPARASAAPEEAPAG